MAIYCQSYQLLVMCTEDLCEVNSVCRRGLVNDSYQFIASSIGRLVDRSNQTQPAMCTTSNFDTSCIQHLESAPRVSRPASGTEIENMRTAVLPPNGWRETMTYNADLRMAEREV